MQQRIVYNLAHVMSVAGMGLLGELILGSVFGNSEITKYKHCTTHQKSIIYYWFLLILGITILTIKML